MEHETRHMIDSTPHIFPRQTGVATAVEAIQVWANQSRAASVMGLVQMSSDREEAEGLGRCLSGTVSAFAPAWRLPTRGGHRSCPGPL